MYVQGLLLFRKSLQWRSPLICCEAASTTKWKNAFKDAYILYTWLASQCESHKEVAPYRQSLEDGFAVLHGVLERGKQSLSKYFRESKLDITYLSHLAVYTMHN